MQEPPRRPASGTRSRGPLVLLVEDDESTREVLAAELAAAGFMVLEAGDGATAVEKALTFGPHAVVLDMVLPGIDGFKVARRLRSEDHLKDTVLIAVTALVSNRLRELALAAGCDAFFSKPVGPGVLVAELVRQLGRRAARPSGPDLSRVRGRG